MLAHLICKLNARLSENIWQSVFQSNGQIAPFSSVPAVASADKLRPNARPIFPNAKLLNENNFKQFPLLISRIQKHVSKHMLSFK